MGDRVVFFFPLFCVSVKGGDELEITCSYELDYFETWKDTIHSTLRTTLCFRNKKKVERKANNILE